jgi:Ca2+/Na+ antiporter
MTAPQSGQFKKPATWKLVYLIGFIIVGTFLILEFLGIDLPHDFVAWVDLIGGVLLIAGACEAFVISVEGIAHNFSLTDYVSGIYASLASTIPELSVIIFLLIAEQFEMAWVLALSTIFMNSLVFASYTLILPKDEFGNYRLPDAIMWVGSDLLTMGAVISLAVGLSMLLVGVFPLGEAGFSFTHLQAGELVVFGLCLLTVFVAYLFTITKYYGKREEPIDHDGEDEGVVYPHLARKRLALYLVVASVGALLGGEALSSFANFASGAEGLNLSYIHTALLLVVFGGTPEYIIVASSHRKEEIEVALSNAFGGIVQVFFVIFGFTLFASGIMGFVLNIQDVIPIDLFSVVLLFFAFPSMFLLRQMITDDASVNALESIAMIAVFVMMLYILLMYGV